jgi:hypothetical protein
MNNKLLPIVTLVCGLAAGAVIGAHHSPEHDGALPVKINKADMSGAIFERPDTVKTTRGENTVLDVTTLKSSDGKFASGMYRSGKSHLENSELVLLLLLLLRISTERVNQFIILTLIIITIIVIIIIVIIIIR